MIETPRGGQRPVAAPDQAWDGESNGNSIA